MRKLFTAVLILSASMLFGQIAKTGGLLYSNGNPNTRGIDTLVTKNLPKNSEVCVDYSTGTIYTFDRSDSSFVKYDSRPYKVYAALLTQTGVAAPTAVVLENTLGVVPTLSYITVGEYRISVSGTFVDNKTWVIIPYTDAAGTDNSYAAVRTSADRVVILTTTAGVSTNALLINHPIEIRVYD